MATIRDACGSWPLPEPLFYIQDTRGVVGNSALFGAKVVAA